MKYLYWLLCLAPLVCFSQKKVQRDTSSILVQTDRVEFMRQTNDSEFTLINAGNTGLLVLEDTDQREGKDKGWNLSLLDTAFTVARNEKIFLPAEYILYGYSHFRDNFYFLYQKSPYRTKDFALVKMDVAQDTIWQYDLTTVFPVEISHFEVLDDMVIIAGYANFRPVVITYSITDQIPRVLPGIYDERNDIVDIVIDRENKLFTVLTQERVRKKYFTVRFRTYTSNGDLVVNTLIDPGEKQSIVDAAITNFSGGRQYVAGTHSKKSLEYSKGFYLGKYINGRQQLQKYYGFSELENFWGYLKPKREQRIKGRISRRKEKGKSKKFSYRLLVNKIIENDDGYIMVAEAYFPRYSYASPSVPSFYGSSRTNMIFLGYEWTHAVVIGFDKNCQILWDHSFKIEDKESYYLQKTVGVSELDDVVVLSYLEDNEIRSKFVKDKEIIEGATFNPIKLYFKEDEAKDYEDPNQRFETWYDNVSIAYGEQNIRNTLNATGLGERKVFYVNKVRYRLK